MPAADAAATEGRLETVSGAILLGGASSRMGRDKAALEVAGVAAVTRLARLLARIFGDVLLVGGRPPEDAPGRRISDPAGPASPLLGGVAARAAARAPRVRVAATDHLLLTPHQRLGLCSGCCGGVGGTRPSDGPQPLCALYRRAPVLPIARARLASDDLSLRGLLGAIPEVSFLEAGDLRELDPDGTALLNVNTPEDLERAEAALRAGAR